MKFSAPRRALRLSTPEVDRVGAVGDRGPERIGSAGGREELWEWRVVLSGTRGLLH